MGLDQSCILLNTAVASPLFETFPAARVTLWDDFMQHGGTESHNGSRRTKPTNRVRLFQEEAGVQDSRGLVLSYDLVHNGTLQTSSHDLVLYERTNQMIFYTVSLGSSRRHEPHKYRFYESN